MLLREPGLSLKATVAAEEEDEEKGNGSSQQQRNNNTPSPSVYCSINLSLCGSQGLRNKRLATRLVGGYSAVAPPWKLAQHFYWCTYFCVKISWNGLGYRRLNAATFMQPLLLSLSPAKWFPASSRWLIYQQEVLRKSLSDCPTGLWIRITDLPRRSSGWKYTFSPADAMLTASALG